MTSNPEEWARCGHCRQVHPRIVVELGPYGVRSCNLCRGAYEAAARTIGTARRQGADRLIELSDGRLVFEVSPGDTVARVYPVEGPFAIDAIAANHRRYAQAIVDEKRRAFEAENGG